MGFLVPDSMDSAYGLSDCSSSMAAKLERLIHLVKNGAPL
jgi:hypothetical protein